MCLNPLRRCRSLLHRSLLPRRHWRCSSALPIRPCMSGGINFPRGEEGEGDDATATQNNEWSLPNGRKRGLRARSEEKNHRRGTQTVHASNLKSWEPGEEVLCYFSRAHQFEVGSLLSSLAGPSSSSAHAPFLIIRPISPLPFRRRLRRRREAPSTWMCGLPFLTATVRKTTSKLQESESGLSALLPLRRSHLCGKCSEKPLMVIRSAVAAPE